jgi:hypothetical protein
VRVIGVRERQRSLQLAPDKGGRGQRRRVGRGPLAARVLFAVGGVAAAVDRRLPASGAHRLAVAGGTLQ